MNFGDIYWVNLEDTHPPEFGKTRPGLIVSHSEHNKILATVVITPLSARPAEIWPLRLEVRIPNLPKKSYAVIPGVRQVNKQRLLDFIGSVDAASANHIQEALNTYLSP
jgi:hypothetical protein